MQIHELVEKIKELSNQGRRVEMIPYMKEYIHQIEQTKDEKWLISALNEYGGALRDVGRSQEAVDTLVRAQKHAANSYGLMSTDYATILSNLANAERVNKQFEQAIEHFEQAKALYKLNGASGNLVAGVYHNLALCYLDQGEIEKGYELQLEEIRLLKGEPAWITPYAIALQNIGATAAQLHQFPQAIRYIEESEHLVIKTFGEKSSLLAGILNTKAFILVNMKKYKEAKDNFLRALSVIERSYGTASGPYASVKSNIEFLEQTHGV